MARTKTPGLTPEPWAGCKRSPCLSPGLPNMAGFGFVLPYHVARSPRSVLIPTLRLLNGEGACRPARIVCIAEYVLPDLEPSDEAPRVARRKQGSEVFGLIAKSLQCLSHLVPAIDIEAIDVAAEPGRLFPRLAQHFASVFGDRLVELGVVRHQARP